MVALFVLFVEEDLLINVEEEGLLPVPRFWQSQRNSPGRPFSLWWKEEHEKKDSLLGLGGVC